MRATIRDTEALKAVSPAALLAYARAAGWSKAETYGDHSDVYVAHGRPEIILPRTERLGDYANVVSRLIEIFADAEKTDELSLYQDLVTIDRDVIRVRATENGDGAVAVDDGLALLRGARDLLLAATCSLWNPRPLYRAGSNREAVEQVQRIRLGQTEQGSFVITLLTPVVASPTQPVPPDDWRSEGDPVERQITKQLTGALTAARAATKRSSAGSAQAFFEAVKEGVSANLCDALGTLIEPFPALDISVTWARTLPRQTPRETVPFDYSDAPILREAAQSFRETAQFFRNGKLRPDVPVTGIVRQLKRDKSEGGGRVELRALTEGRNQLVTAVLQSFDYERAIEAHLTETPIIMDGDLKLKRQRWHLLNARILGRHF